MLALLRHRFTPRILSTFVFELIALNMCLMAVVWTRSFLWTQRLEDGGFGSTFQQAHLGVAFALCCTLVIQFVLWSCGLYSRRVVYCGKRVFLNLARAFVLLTIGLLPVCFLFSLSGEILFDVTVKFDDGPTRVRMLKSAIATVANAEAKSDGKSDGKD